MTQYINILVVEDDAEQVTLYESGINEFNEEEKGFQIIPVFENEFESADSTIRSQNFDAAFIDLNLVPSSGELEGKKLVEAIRTSSRYPIYIVSGSIDADMKALAEDNSFVEACDRDEFDTFRTLNEDVLPMYKSGITKVFGSKGLIEEALHKTFWEHLAPSKSYWLTHRLNGHDDLEKIVLRYALNHIHEFMEKEIDGRKVEYDPSEMYIKPSIQEEMHTGKILVNGGEYSLVLSPACDIAQGCDNYIVVKLIKLEDHPEIISARENEVSKKTDMESFESEFLDKIAVAQGDKSAMIKIIEENENKKSAYTKSTNSTKSKIKGFVKNNKGSRYHFLPEFLDFEAHIADFQDIKTLTMTDVAGFNPSLSISESFLKDIQSRFSSYYARQGSPDFDFDALATAYYAQA